MRRFLVSMFFVAALLFGGTALAGFLVSLRKPPPEKMRKMPVLAVEAVKVTQSDQRVLLEGWGTLRARNRYGIIPEVSGAVAAIREHLEPGDRVEKGDLLLQVDPQHYQYAVDRVRADLKRLEASLDRIALLETGDKKRLAVLKKTRALARAEYERVKTLFERDKVGSLSAVEGAERAVLSIDEPITGLENGLTLYPVQVRELKAQLASARVQLKSAELNLEKTRVYAPVAGRIEMAGVELGQVVSPGRELIRIVDDTVLELPVTLDGRDLVEWIPFENVPADRWWFGTPAAGPVRVSWVENPATHTVAGKLVRIERYDPGNRTATAVVEIIPGPGSPRLVEGMFCKAVLPGRVAEKVFRVPRAGVAHDGTVYLVREGRLAVSRVEVVRSEASHAFVRSGIVDGDTLIVSRLLAPSEGSPVKVVLLGDEEGGGR